MEVPAKLQDFEFAKKFWNLATELLASKQVIAHPVKDGSGGLEGVLGGLNKLEEETLAGYLFRVGAIAPRGRIGRLLPLTMTNLSPLI